jgi:hypothetical protein
VGRSGIVPASEERPEQGFHARDLAAIAFPTIVHHELVAHTPVAAAAQRLGWGIDGLSQIFAHGSAPSGDVRCSLATCVLARNVPYRPRWARRRSGFTRVPIRD